PCWRAGSHGMRRHAEVSRKPARGRSTGSLGRPNVGAAGILHLQRTAGNAAVSQLLTGRPTVQRHAGMEPAAAAHIPTAAEQADMPTVAQAPDLKREQAELEAEKKQLQKKIDTWKPPQTDDEKQKQAAADQLEA